jgi:hypothetical protein
LFFSTSYPHAAAYQAFLRNIFPLQLVSGSL